MKTLLMVNGPPGVGKTSVCQELNKKLQQSVWLDGDWCWMINPFVVTEENKDMVEDNITHLLRNFLNNSSCQSLIFSWVIPREEIFAILLNRLEDLEFRVVKVTLVCSEDVLKQRMADGGRPQDQVDNSVAGMAKFRAMNTVMVDTTEIDPSQAAVSIIELLA